MKQRIRDIYISAYQSGNCYVGIMRSAMRTYENPTQSSLLRAQRAQLALVKRSK